MSEHDEKGEERVEDLDVPEGDSEEVKGGLSLNYSKIEVQYKPGAGAQKIQPGQLGGPDTTNR